MSITHTSSEELGLLLLKPSAYMKQSYSFLLSLTEVIPPRYLLCVLQTRYSCKLHENTGASKHLLECVR